MPRHVKKLNTPLYGQNSTPTSKNLWPWAAILVLLPILCFRPAGSWAENGSLPIRIAPIKLGMSAGFSSSIKEISTDLLHGSLLYFQQINQNGGINGRLVSLTVYNDDYDPGPAVANTIELVEKDQVLCLFSCVGTPTTTRILPLFTHPQFTDVLLFFPFSGASPLYKTRYIKNIYHLRPSYDKELRTIVQKLLNLGKKRIAVFYQSDAFGRSAWQSIQDALVSRDLKIVSDAAYVRGMKSSDSAEIQVKAVMAGRPQAVISVATAESAVAFIRDLRRAGHTLPVINISSVNALDQHAYLNKLKKKESIDFLDNLVNSQVIPLYTDPDLAAACEYRKLFQENPLASFPPSLDITRMPRLSPIGFEGFLNAKLMAAILEHLGPETTREELARKMPFIGPLDIGLQKPVLFSHQNHVALDTVYFVSFDSQGLVPVKKWEPWVH